MGAIFSSHTCALLRPPHSPGSAAVHFYMSRGSLHFHQHDTRPSDTSPRPGPGNSRCLLGLRPLTTGLYLPAQTPGRCGRKAVGPAQGKVMTLGWVREAGRRNPERQWIKLPQDISFHIRGSPARDLVGTPVHPILYRGDLGRQTGRSRRSRAHLSAQETVNSSYDKALRRVEDSEKGLEEDGATVCHGQDSGHPGERQQWQHHTGAPEGGPRTAAEGLSWPVLLQGSRGLRPDLHTAQGSSAAQNW